MYQFAVSRLSTPTDFEKMLDLFEEVFDDPDSYGKAHRPSAPYLDSLLASQDFIALLAKDPENHVVGALAAYVLRKFEQERAEVYIYDLAVRSNARRHGVATTMIEELKKEARRIGAYVIFVQADKEASDLPAQALYRKLGTEEDVFHYDLSLE